MKSRISEEYKIKALKEREQYGLQREQTDKLESGYKTFFVSCIVYFAFEVCLGIGQIYALTGNTLQSVVSTKQEYAVWVSELIGYAIFARSIAFIFCMLFCFAFMRNVVKALKNGL